MVVVYTYWTPFRGFATVAYWLTKYLEERGVRVEKIQVGIPLWCLPNPKQTVICIDHWFFTSSYIKKFEDAAYKIGYLFTEGPIEKRFATHLNLFDEIIVASDYCREKFEEAGFEVSKVVPVGIDTKLFRPMRVLFKSDVLSVGVTKVEYDKRKFTHLIPEICDGLRYYVHFGGELKISMMPYLYNSFKVFLSTSAAEAFSIPCLEAMACGVPVVYNKIPCLDYVVGIGVKPLRRVVEYISDLNKKADIIRPFKNELYLPDPKGLREAIIRLISNEKLLEKLGRKARKEAEKFDYRKTFRGMEKYESWG